MGADVGAVGEKVGAVVGASVGHAGEVHACECDVVFEVERIRLY